jgi:hypothetical protein
MFQHQCKPMLMFESLRGSTEMWVTNNRVIISGIKIFNNLPSSLKSLMNEKAKFKVALKQYLNTHAFYSVDEFLLSKNDSSC